MKGVLIRLQDGELETLGRFFAFDDLAQVFQCVTLELPDRNNENSISRIPAGVYTCVERSSAKYGKHFHVKDVNNRTLILIHFGNYYTNTRGCLLFGKNFADINKDGVKDITSSKNTMIDLMLALPESWELTIID